MNLVDYRILREMHLRLPLYQTNAHDVDELKQRTLRLARSLEQNVINDAIIEWRKRLRAGIRAEGGHLKGKR